MAKKEILDDLDLLFEQDRFNPYDDDSDITDEDICPDECPCNDCMDLEDFISAML